MNRYLELLEPIEPTEPMARSYSYDVSYDTSDDLYHQLMMDIAEGHNDDLFSAYADMDETAGDVDETWWDVDETWWHGYSLGYAWFDPAFYLYDTLFADDTVGPSAGA